MAIPEKPSTYALLTCGKLRIVLDYRSRQALCQAPDANPRYWKGERHEGLILKMHMLAEEAKKERPYNVIDLKPNMPVPDQAVEDTHWAMDVLPLADDDRHKCIRLMIPTRHEAYLFECLKPFVQRLSGNT
jgi:hypothetical protein